ncbi:class D sortase [Clostridium thermobutyricum]|uniref:class D sortase n=1 Tax=Clostridium thermobutyricum TaxID=29372 RepID=UPI0018ABB0FF|nr:class D sortase [Clostridium thermobutyricum]
MKKYWKKILIVILFIIGIGLIGRYVFVRVRYHERMNTMRTAMESSNPVQRKKALEIVEQDYKVKPVGVLQIPAIGVNNGIVEGTTMYDMFFGVGWDMQSPFPNMTEMNTGNLVLAAHDQGYAPIFEKLPTLQNGDAIYLYYEGNTYIYQVYNKFPVLPTDISVAKNVPDKSMMTLYTCIDGGNKRMIVQAKLIDRFKGTGLMKNDKDKPIRDFNNGEDGPYLKALREGRVNSEGQII